MAENTIVAATKMDLHGAQDGLDQLQAELPVDVLPISAVTGQGLRALIGRILRMLQEADEPADDPAVEL